MSLIVWIYLIFVIVPNVIITTFLFLDNARKTSIARNLWAAIVFLFAGVFIVGISLLEVKRVGVEEMKNASEDHLKKIINNGVLVGIAVYLAVAIFGVWL